MGNIDKYHPPAVSPCVMDEDRFVQDLFDGSFRWSIGRLLTPISGPDSRLHAPVKRVRNIVRFARDGVELSIFTARVLLSILSSGRTRSSIIGHNFGIPHSKEYFD